MPGTNEALADAFSGVVGTLVSLWCFYPIERLKTNVQAGTTKCLSSSTTMPLPLPSSSSSSSSSSSPSGTYSLETILKWFRQSFRGCGTKSLHATASSFCYFYFYSWILSVHHARRRKRKIAGPLRPSTGLVLAAIAAMMNTFVTLPLDVLSSRRTVGNGDSEAKATLERNASTATATGTATGTGTGTKTTTTKTKTKTKTKTMTAKSAESAGETSQSKASGDQPHRAMMAKAWNSIGKGEAPGQNPSSQKAPTASTSLASSASTSSSPSSEDSPVVELVFHEACGCSEDLLSLDRDGNGNSNSNNNSNSNSNSNSSHNSGGSNEEADDRDHDNNTSRCSQGSSGSGHTMVSQNEEYKARWREHQLQRQADRKRRRQLQEPPRQPLPQPQPQPQPQLQPTQPLPPPLSLPALRIKTYFRKWTRLWKGLAPALLLCSNPSIHYTVFDVLKTNLLAYKTATKRTNPKLSVSEAFVLGLLSKFVATIVTYPLIRAKVLMMVRGDDDDDDDDDDDHNDDDPSRETSRESQRNTLRTSSSSSSLVCVLQESYHRDGGLKGLYKGCDWQLIHTLLKSALMMAIREQITGTSRALFGVRPAARTSS